jgi:hypothetical protein
MLAVSIVLPTVWAIQNSDRLRHKTGVGVGHPEETVRPREISREEYEEKKDIS